MEAGNTVTDFLRVKKWREFQHYDPLKRRPPWIKFFNKVLEPGSDFQYLTEQEQWQLVRLWLLASRSDLLTLDEDGSTLVPVIPNDEPTLRRHALSAKRLPLAKFIQNGWLIEVDASAVASTDDSASLRFRGLEVKKDQNLGLTEGTDEQGQDFNDEGQVNGAVVASMAAARLSKEAAA